MLLGEHKVKREFIGGKNLGHDYPPNFEEALKSALEYILI